MQKSVKSVFTQITFYWRTFLQRPDIMFYAEKRPAFGKSEVRSTSNVSKRASSCPYMQFGFLKSDSTNLVYVQVNDVITGIHIHSLIK